MTDKDEILATAGALMLLAEKYCATAGIFLPTPIEAIEAAMAFSKITESSFDVKNLIVKGVHGRLRFLSIGDGHHWTSMEFCAVAIIEDDEPASEATKNSIKCRLRWPGVTDAGFYEIKRTWCAR